MCKSYFRDCLPSLNSTNLGKSYFSGAAGGSGSSQPSLRSTTRTATVLFVSVYGHFLSRSPDNIPIYESWWNVRVHRREGVPLGVGDEPPGPRPASHNIGLLVRPTAATFGDKNTSLSSIAPKSTTTCVKIQKTNIKTAKETDF